MNRRSSGFTLMEMLIVVAIIAVLAGVGIGYYGDYIEEARMATARTNLKIVRDAISRYFKDHMTYPTSLESLQGPYLQQPTTSLLLEPLAGNGIIMVEVVDNVHYPDDYNVFQATATELIAYVPATHNNRQIKNIRIIYNSVEMNW
jgi:prepilin-type N-terminal cleavage/methylation domain-containing protein